MNIDELFKLCFEKGLSAEEYQRRCMRYWEQKQKENLYDYAKFL